MNDSRTEVDSSKRQTLVNRTPSRKRCVIENQNGATQLGGEIDAFKDGDNHQEENRIKLNAEAILRDEERVNARVPQ